VFHRPVVFALAFGLVLSACDDSESDRPVRARIEGPRESDSPTPTKVGDQEPPDISNILGGGAPSAIPAPEDVAAPPEDAERSESGLAWKILQPGTGDAHPGPRDTVTVNYTGWTTDGNMFDSSQTRGEPLSIPLDRVVPGWTEGVQLMVTGEKRRFWIPQELAYQGRPGAPAGMLVFDVELISFEAAPELPPTPRDVARVPPNAQRTPSGLAHRVIERGQGTEHPTPTSMVQVHYTGWTTDGELIESSISAGRPATFPLNRATMQGWIEGIQLMVKGEKRRFWIPPELAQTGRPGGPEGMVVFDIELVDVIEAPQMPQGMPRGPAGRR
jgi:peptidylprolyl isomerase